MPHACAPGLALALCASDAAAADPVAPFSNPQVAAADSGETAVLWNTLDGAGRAAIGMPGGSFGRPATVTPPVNRAAGGTAVGSTAVVMDGAGDVVVIWEAIHGHDCNKVCTLDSLGVFATVRPAGGAFGAPVRLSAGRAYQLAEPRVVMNRAGDWLVMMKQGPGMVIGAGTGATAPGAFAALPVAGFAPEALAIGEAGDVTFAGRDAAHRPLTLVRKRDGSFADVGVLDDASIEFRALALGVGPQGHAVVVWPGGGFLRSASRAPGGSFGAPVSSTVASDLVVPESIGVDGQGRTVTLTKPAPVSVEPVRLEAWRGTVAAPFFAPVALSAADRHPGISRLAMGAGGSAAVGWTEADGSGRSGIAHVAIATDAGPLSAPLALSRTTFGMADTPAVAIDGAGRAVLAWTQITADLQRVRVIALTPRSQTGASDVVTVTVRRSRG